MTIGLLGKSSNFHESLHSLPVSATTPSRPTVTELFRKAEYTQSVETAGVEVGERDGSACSGSQRGLPKQMSPVPRGSVSFHHALSPPCLL